MKYKSLIVHSKTLTEYFEFMGVKNEGFKRLWLVLHVPYFLYLYISPYEETTTYSITYCC